SHDRGDSLPLDRGRRLQRGRLGARRSALGGDDARRHRRQLPHLRLLERLHGARPRLLSLLHVALALRIRDAHPRHGRQLPSALRRLGRRRPLQLPAHRVLVRTTRAVLRGEAGVRDEPDRGLGIHDRHHRDLPRLRVVERGRRLPAPRRERARTARAHAHLRRAVLRSDWKVRPAAAPLVAPGRDGRPDAGVRAHPRGHDGHRGRLPRRTVHPALHRGGIGADTRRGRRHPHGHLRRDDRPGAGRYQAGHGVLDRQPARLHVPRARCRRADRRDLPPRHTRVLQGAPVPWVRLGDPRDGQRPGHAALRRPAPEASLDLLDDAHRGGALSAIPPLAGFWSKDEIVGAAFTNGYPLLWGVGVLTGALTAFYVTRALWLTFHGEPRDHHLYEHAHESPPVMVLPLAAPAVGRALGGFLA